MMTRYPARRSDQKSAATAWNWREGICGKAGGLDGWEGAMRQHSWHVARVLVMSEDKFGQKTPLCARLDIRLTP